MPIGGPQRPDRTVKPNSPPHPPHHPFGGRRQNENHNFHRKLNVVALWEAFHIETKCFDLDSLRVPDRSPTPISKSNDCLGQSDADSRSIQGPGPVNKHIFVGHLKRPPC